MFLGLDLCSTDFEKILDATRISLFIEISLFLYPLIFLKLASFEGRFIVKL